jgi:SAM-dependent methyltransferase
MNLTEKNLNLREKFFLKFYCHPPPGLPAPIEENVELRMDGALDLFETHLGNIFIEEIRDKNVLDLGCGIGGEVLGAALKGARHCCGVDIRPLYGAAEEKAKELGISDKVHFTTQALEDLEPDSIDVVMSQNSFEHFSDPKQILADVYSILKPGGKFIITFSPPWLNPFGVHMFFMIKYPWAHIFFSEKTILTVRKLYRSDGAERYADVDGGLNQMTIRKFRRIVKESNFSFQKLEVTPIKILPPFFKHIPFLNEFTTSTVSAILVK